MLSLFLKRVLSGYDEKRYQIRPGDYSRILRANAAMEESARLDLRLQSLSVRKIRLILDAVSIDLPSDGIVVDLCCGTGYVARGLLLAQRVRHVVGIDLSASQLSLLKRASDRRTKIGGRLRLVQADTFALPLKTGSVSAIIGNSFLHHLPDVGAALIEIKRVIKPGGQFMVLHEPSLTATFFESFPLSLFKNICVENYTDLWQFDSSELHRMLEEAGFSEIRILRTGVLANVLLGTFSTLVNKFWPRWDAVQVVIEYLKGSLAAFEYRYSWSIAPSLLVQASRPHNARPGV